MIEPADAAHTEVHRRLVAAWWSIGLGGLLLLMSIALFSGSPRNPSRAVLGMASLGAVLGISGVAAVKRSRRELLAAAASYVLPVARVV
jgi:hypothetical protein